MNGYGAGTAYYCSATSTCAGSLDQATFPGFITAYYSFNQYGVENQIYYGATTVGYLFAGEQDDLLAGRSRADRRSRSWDMGEILHQPEPDRWAQTSPTTPPADWSRRTFPGPRSITATAAVHRA